MKQKMLIETPLGEIEIEEEGGFIVRISFGSTDDGHAAESPLLRCAALQLKEYFRGERRRFELPVAFCGTQFQNEVWKKLCETEYGEVKRYSEIAAEIGRPKSCRAVGGACGGNPVAIVVPCHRILGSNGLTGYAGGLWRKEWLLNHEKVSK